jgi:hypothetical protein
MSLDDHATRIAAIIKSEYDMQAEAEDNWDSPLVKRVSAETALIPWVELREYWLDPRVQQADERYAWGEHYDSLEDTVRGAIAAHILESIGHPFWTHEPVFDRYASPPSTITELGEMAKRFAVEDGVAPPDGGEWFREEAFERIVERLVSGLDWNPLCDLYETEEVRAHWEQQQFGVEGDLREAVKWAIYDAIAWPYWWTLEEDDDSEPTPPNYSPNP